ncbi:hypothetical protein DV737_g3671, partial [Chaetothyriales sp. CBS 132003]
MDSTPSPATPAYGYSDVPLAPYDSIIRQDAMPASANVTPFMEQHIMIDAPASTVQHVPVKPGDGLPSIQQYSILPGLAQTDMAPLASAAASHNPSAFPPPAAPPAKASPSLNHSSGKKNKYPCPYAQSHDCVATFTTSGHAARHGKKHTGEKGVHCPICKKAFTRKDNMKQHERTHKASASSSASDDASTRRSKAVLTREAQKNRAAKQDSVNSEPTPQSVSVPLIPSPLSQSMSRATSNPERSVGYEDPSLYPEPTNPSLLSTGPLPPNVPPGSVYPPLADDGLLAPEHLPLAHAAKAAKLSNTLLPSLPTLVRGFSDLDTLAQAAETFDPYYPPVL